MIRTIAIKLTVSETQNRVLKKLALTFAHVRNANIVPVAIENRCWNRVALHQLVYSNIRKVSDLGSQMVCNAIWSVCRAYKSKMSREKYQKTDPLPVISFRNASIHFDKRTYTFLKNGTLSLYTLSGRIEVSMKMGKRQEAILKRGVAKEAELICRNGCWYFHLCIELQEVKKRENGIKLGVDVGENNLAATNTGKVLGGKELKYKRDRYLAMRRRLQSNGTQSAKQHLRKVSGKERRHVAHINHTASKQIVYEAVEIGASEIVLEDLTDIRENIKANKRIRSRLHRWPFRQLQQFIEYKAEERGIGVRYVSPAYTSVRCSSCHEIGNRKRHFFECFKCGLRTHADCNASQNLVRIGSSIDNSRATCKLA